MQVSILHLSLRHYRVSLFNGLRSALAQKNIDLNLLYGKNSVSSKKDECDLDWAHPVSNWLWGLRDWSVCWQQVPEEILKSDLIVLPQELKTVSGHMLFAKAKAKHRKVALWGHGVNRQAPGNSVGNTIKKMYANRASWWFAYTEGVKTLVSGLGFPSERITVVQNAIDTRLLREEAARFNEGELKRLRASVGIGDGPVGLFCGAMYKEKRLAFLLDACCKIRESIAEFEMIFIGAGPDSQVVVDAARQFPWIHYVGPKLGIDAVPFMKLADVFLMPGAVGLGILDAFALQKPFITTTCLYHGPEIEYLVNGQNGILTQNSLDAFVSGVLEVITSVDLRKRIQAGCREASSIYTVEHMVENFARGIEAALAMDPAQVIRAQRAALLRD